jgi:tyrosine aminotransferase
MTWFIKPSLRALETVNPIRDIVDKLDFNNLPKEKDLVSLSIGDPTKYGNFPVPMSAVQAVVRAVEDGESNGYQPSFGNQKAQEAIAKRYSTKENKFVSKDVFIGSGCSDAINMSLCSLLNPGDNILLPAPGFSLYTTLCGRYNFKPRYYNLLPERQWEVDLNHLESLIDRDTKCILINNPSNPCGSSYSKDHLSKLCALAYKHKLPILADEIYADMVFENENFTSCCNVTPGPVFILGGLAKQFLAPGWRVGWIVLHDPESRLKEVRQALVSLSQIILGSNSICQAALPEIFDKTPNSFYFALNKRLSQAADLLYTGFLGIPGLSPIQPQGAMYLMVKS